MRVGVAMVQTKRDHAYEVDDESGNRDKEKSLGVDVGWLHKSVQSLHKDKQGNHHKEEAIHKTTQDLHAPVAIGVESCGLPAAHEGGVETHHQSCAVKEHMEAIRDEAQTVGPHSIQQLNEREGLRGRESCHC